MSSANVCKACGGLTEWDASVGSCVCIECGTLEDATQVVLAADLEPHERNSRSVHGPGPMLKSLRKPGWDLDGQSKEARVYRNRVRAVSSPTGIAD
jgi:transcription factor IIIB subunit 2